MLSVDDFFRKMKALTKQNVLVLIGIAIVSSSLLILINYFTIKTTSAVRAYINGESQYSKGQKDASRFLIMYCNTGNPQFWQNFLREIQVPIGDSLARVELMQNGNEEIIKKGFLQGRNHKDDLDNMIWLFRNFKNISFMEETIQIWKEGDVLIGELHTIGKSLHSQLSAGTTIPEVKKQQIIEKINVITAKLTEFETAFSENLGAAARTINTYLFYTNFVMTLLIVGSSGGFAIVMIRQLKEKNYDLMATNEELDKFVYSASHDLRSPLTSLKGLIEVASMEEVSEQMKTYFSLMQQTLDKQDEFIREIIDYSRNKRTSVAIGEVSLACLIDEAIAQHRHMKGENEITIEKEIKIDKIYGDQLRLRIIINNIISNAFKYTDARKEYPSISIKTYPSNGRYVIEVADNGIGIKKESQDRIFDMFYSTVNRKGGSGLGLYITKETVQKLNGDIKVASEVGKGSKFVINIPNTYENQLQISDRR